MYTKKRPWKCLNLSALKIVGKFINALNMKWVSGVVQKPLLIPHNLKLLLFFLFHFRSFARSLSLTKFRSPVPFFHGPWEHISMENYVVRLCMCARQHSKPQRLFDNVDLLLLLNEFSNTLYAHIHTYNSLKKTTSKLLRVERKKTAHKWEWKEKNWKIEKWNMLCSVLCVNIRWIWVLYAKHTHYTFRHIILFRKNW